MPRAYHELESEFRTMFGYYGNKRKAVDQNGDYRIWERLGDPELYVEPFSGTASVLFGRPTVLREPEQELPPAHRREIINDFSPFVANFMRSMRAEPDKVADNYFRRVSLPVMPRWEAGQQVKLFLKSGEERLRSNLQDLDYYDITAAAQFLYINENSLRQAGMKGNGRPTLQRGRVRPNVFILDALGWGSSANTRLALSRRLRDVEITCRDWYEVVADLDRPATIFLDPPYRIESGVNPEIYDYHRPELAIEVATWAIANAHRHRIAIAGYEGDYEGIPSTWEKLSWKSDGGRGRADWERIWFSP
jgi:site-specific DNA-adenine methylase